MAEESGGSDALRQIVNRLLATLRRFARLLMPAALFAMTLTACAAIQGTAMRASGACIAFSPITFSANRDTATTVEQVRGHNAAWDAICKEPK